MSLLRCLVRSFHCLRRPALPAASHVSWRLTLRRTCSSLYDERNFVEDEKDTDEGSEDEAAQEEEEEEDADLDDEEYEQFVPRNLRLSGSPHNLLVIQPKVKYGPANKKLYERTTPELQLEEACTLVHSLDGWKVVESLIIGTSSPTRRLVFGPGTNDMLREHIKRKKVISGVFYSVNTLIGWKQGELEDMLQVPVFDRFSIVLHIFKERAKTRESRLQLALAELPYVKTRLREAAQQRRQDISGAGGWFGSGNTFYERRIDIMKERERKIKRKIAELKVKRQVARNQRQKLKIPTIAVVGYTNCGKTSLIKSLTGSTRLVPLDKLFATLDVRLFPGRLPRVHHVLYIDTIGFISDIPTDLIESFKTTLEEVNLADLIIHVQDVSHPDLKNQRQTVHATLKEMAVSQKLLATMAEVGNKVDKVQAAAEGAGGGGEEERESDWKVDLLISATEQTNLPALKDEVEKRLLINMGCFLGRVRVATGGDEYSWLLRNAIVLSTQVDDSHHNFVFMDVRFTEAVAGKFRRLFGSSSFVRQREAGSPRRSSALVAGDEHDNSCSDSGNHA